MVAAFTPVILHHVICKETFYSSMHDQTNELKNESCDYPLSCQSKLSVFFDD